MKERRVSPFAKFRVYPDKKRYHYFTVYVFGNKRDMIEAVNGTNHPMRRPRSVKKGEYDAITLPYFVTKPPSKEILRDLGNIVFYRARTGTGCISHEMTHAAAHYLRVKGHETIGEGEVEELMAQVVGNLTRQFVVRY